jgi:DNA-binding LytR/AlgR family response regulator
MAREIISTHLSKIDNIEVIASCSNAIEAFQEINKHAIDLVFLDINMPEISGISFAKSINKNIKVIFTTAYRDYAVEGFELRAVDYLLKPISFERFSKAISAFHDTQTPVIVEASSETSSNDFIFVRSDRVMLKIDFNTIIYIESYSDYIKIHTGKKVVVTRETISAIDAKLPKDQFLRIHRSFIVAISKISSFTSDHVVIENQSLPISRSYKKEVQQRLNFYQ